MQYTGENMSGYAFLLLILKILILSSMFFVLRSYGIKGLLKFSAVLLVVFLLVLYFISFNKSKSSDIPPKQTSLETHGKQFS